MIWLTWRHYRVAIGIGIVLLVALCFAFVLDANTLNAALQQHHFTHCYDTSADYIPCGLMIIPGSTVSWRSLAEMLLPWLPLLIGVFLGAPLLPREYDQRTHLFAWTQSTSPTRWLSIKLVMIGGITLIGFGLLSWITTWWGGDSRRDCLLALADIHDTRQRAGGKRAVQPDGWRHDRDIPSSHLAGDGGHICSVAPRPGRDKHEISPPASSLKPARLLP